MCCDDDDHYHRGIGAYSDYPIPNYGGGIPFDDGPFDGNPLGPGVIGGPGLGPNGPGNNFPPGPPAPGTTIINRAAGSQGRARVLGGGRARVLGGRRRRMRGGRGHRRMRRRRRY